MTAAPRPPLATRLGDGGRAVLDWFFPPVCACCHFPVRAPDGPGLTDILCRACRRDIRVVEAPPCGQCQLGADASLPECERCKALPASFDSATSAFPYAGVVGQIIRNMKYRHGPHLASPLARLTVAANGSAIQRLLGEERAEAIVPVPMAPLRRLRRGFNQAEVLAAELGAILHLPVLADAMTRQRTPPQARKSGPEARLANVSGAFRVIDPMAVAEKRLILLDDVMTTGATAACCAGALKDAGAEAVHILTVTRAGAGALTRLPDPQMTLRDERMS
ncbi:MAG: hypothetical protein RLY93_08510 [Sumerlaeia bacterium]